jgi:hypothetical protein
MRKLLFLLTLIGAGYLLAQVVGPDLKKYYEISSM